MSKPTYIGGRVVYVDAPVYLRRQVRDIKPSGLSHSREVEEILREMDEDLKHGISPQTINARTRTLFLAVLHSSKMPKSEKMKSIRLINRFRRKLGWKPFRLKKPL
ncbi:MAG: hypothetical protein DRJ18_01765 [Candidatus Methanomethylicota archaeon]|nr:MAG: hypothetical protein DRJ18_01765 [Candidatus Verstraetearchaeota archaeon]